MGTINTADSYSGRGRPAKWDVEEEARLLLEWVKKPDSVRLLDFANERGFWSGQYADWEKENENFSYALKKAKDVLASRREKLANEGVLNYGIYNRNQLIYDHSLKMSEREEKAYEASLRTKVEASQNECSAQAIAKAVKEINDSSK